MSDETQKPSVEDAKVIPLEPKPEEKPSRGGRRSEPKVQVPSLGRTVLYVTAQGTIRPAVISALNEDTVDVTLFNSEGAVPLTDIPFDSEFPGETPGTVFWPTIN